MSNAPTAERQSAMTPDDVLSWLRAGAQRFTDGQAAARDALADAAATSGGQHPLAAIVGCIDSRVPPETVFDLGIGDAFAARTAGNVVGADVLGSLEFAAAVAGVKAIVVLGHSACGAVKGACDGVELGHLTGLLAKIAPAVDEAAGPGGTASGDDDALVQRAVDANVRNVALQIVTDSDVLSGLVDAGELVVAGAVYDLTTAAVRWLDPD